MLQLKVKLKQDKPLGLPDFPDNRRMNVTRLSAPRIRRLYPHHISLVLFSVRGWVEHTAIVRPEGSSESKTPIIPSGIEPEPFRVVTHLYEGYSRWCCDTVWSRTRDLLKWKFIQERKMFGSETIMILVSVKYIVKNKEIPHLNLELGNNLPIACPVRHFIV